MMLLAFALGAGGGGAPGADPAGILGVAMIDAPDAFVLVQSVIALTRVRATVWRNNLEESMSAFKSAVAQPQRVGCAEGA